MVFHESCLRRALTHAAVTYDSERKSWVGLNLGRSIHTDTYYLRGGKIVRQQENRGHHSGPPGTVIAGMVSSRVLRQLQRSSSTDDEPVNFSICYAYAAAVTRLFTDAMATRKGPEVVLHNVIRRDEARGEYSILFYSHYVNLKWAVVAYTGPDVFGGLLTGATDTARTQAEAALLRGVKENRGILYLFNSVECIGDYGILGCIRKFAEKSGYASNSISWESIDKDFGGSDMGYGMVAVCNPAVMCKRVKGTVSSIVWFRKSGRLMTKAASREFLEALKTEARLWQSKHFGIVSMNIDGTGYNYFHGNDLDKFIAKLMLHFPKQWRGWVKGAVAKKGYTYADIEKLTKRHYGNQYPFTVTRPWPCAMTLYCSPPAKHSALYKRYLKSMEWAAKLVTTWEEEYDKNPTKISVELAAL